MNTINICLFHCGRISYNLPRNKSRLGMTNVIVVQQLCHTCKCFIVAKQYYIKECDIRGQYSDSNYYLCDRKTVYFTQIKSFHCSEIGVRYIVTKNH